MKKAIWTAMVLAGCASVFGGSVGLPTERLALPVVQGSHLVCIWDYTLGDWVGGGDFESYDHSGFYEFKLPQWSKWYWIGLWDVAKGEYVYAKWIGHFLTN